MYPTYTPKKFAEHLRNRQSNDFYSFIIFSGSMGSGKSCLATQVAEHTANFNQTKFSYQDNITWLRKEVKTWIDGDKNHKGQKPEKTSIVIDELISLLFKRNFFDIEQIGFIELLNKCRDRHHLIAGCLPHYWDLDSAIMSIVDFWVYIPKRGYAWIFERISNPFAKDPWSRNFNEKMIMKKGGPTKCKGFVGFLRFDDWSPKQKEAYYKVRNTKRLNTEGQSSRMQRYKDIKIQRNNILIALHEHCPDLTQQQLSDVASIDRTTVTKILNGTL